MKEQEKYEEASEALRLASEFAAKIGERYEGGGGGTGEVREVKPVEMVVYHQAYDGATNYHSAPSELRAALAVMVKANAATLLVGAIGILKDKKREAARAFHAKMAEVSAEISTVE